MAPEIYPWTTRGVFAEVLDVIIKQECHVPITFANLMLHGNKKDVTLCVLKLLTLLLLLLAAIPTAIIVGHRNEAIMSITSRVSSFF